MPFYKRKTLKEIENNLREEITKEVKIKYDQHLLDFERSYLVQLKEQLEIHRKDKEEQFTNLSETRKKEFNSLKELHMKELEKLKQDSDNDITQLKLNYTSEISCLKTFYEKELERYILQEKELKKFVRDAQRAWTKMMEVIPQILSLLSMLRAKAEAKTREVAREQSEYSAMLNESEIIDRKLDKLEPTLEKLLHIGSPLLDEEAFLIEQNKISNNLKDILVSEKN